MRNPTGSEDGPGTVASHSEIGRDVSSALRSFVDRVLAYHQTRLIRSECKPAEDCHVEPELPTFPPGCTLDLSVHGARGLPRVSLDGACDSAVGPMLSPTLTGTHF